MVVMRLENMLRLKNHHIFMLVCVFVACWIATAFFDSQTAIAASRPSTNPNTKYDSSVVLVEAKLRNDKQNSEGGSAVVIEKRVENKIIIYTLATARHVVYIKDAARIANDITIKKNRGTTKYKATILGQLPFQLDFCKSNNSYLNQKIYNDIRCRYDIALLEVRVSKNKDPKLEVLQLKQNTPKKGMKIDKAGFPNEKYEEITSTIFNLRNINSKNEDGPLFEGQTLESYNEVKPGHSGGAIIDHNSGTLLGITISSTNFLVAKVDDNEEFRFKNPHTLKVYEIDSKLYEDKTFSVSVQQLCELWKSTHLKKACGGIEVPKQSTAPTSPITPIVTSSNHQKTKIEPAYVEIWTGNVRSGYGFIFKQSGNNYYIASLASFASDPDADDLANKTVKRKNPVLKTKSGIVLRSTKRLREIPISVANPKKITILIASTSSTLPVEPICNPNNRDKSTPCVEFIPDIKKSPLNGIYATELCKKFNEICSFSSRGVL